MTTAAADTTKATIYFIVACSAPKLNTPAPAAQLYTGTTFTNTYRAAVTEAEATTRQLGNPTQVLIISALHGLVDPATVLDPYNTTLADTDAIDALTVSGQLAQRGIYHTDQLFAMVPNAYLALLKAAAAHLDLDVNTVYEGARGVGDHRGVNASLTRTAS